nr:hypothetical protein [Tanacetum cinerariifolium]
MADKGHKRGQMFDWETATYDKIYDDIDVFKDFEAGFPAIVYNDALEFDPKVSSEPTVNSKNDDNKVNISSDDVVVKQLDSGIDANVDTQYHEFDEDFETNHDTPVIMEYFVKISSKARIMELKRRNLKNIVLTFYTSYPSRKIQRICACTSQETMKNWRVIRCIQKINIHRSETLEQTFNRLQAIVSHLEFMDVEIEQDDLNKKFLTSLAPEWLIGKGEVHTASVPTTSTQVSTASTDVVTASINHDTVCAYIASQSNGSQIKYEDITQIDEDDIKEIDIKWNMALLSMKADRFWKKTGKKITIQGSDVAGFDKSKVECFNCHKMGHFARECRAPRSQDRANEEENHALVADEKVLTEFALMAKSSSSSENEVYHRLRLDLLNLKHKKLSFVKKLEAWKEMLRPTPSIDSSKINTSDLQNSISSVSEHVESSNSIISKPMIKFVKAADSPGVIKTNKTETAWKPPVKYTEMYRNTSKILKLGGNSQNNIDDKGYWDSGCSRYMTGNISYLSEYESYDGGYVSFGQGGGNITGKGIIKTGKLEFENVYFVKELKYNLFSVSQICDNKNSVLFIDSECIVLGKDFKLKDDTNVLLRTPRQHNMYSIDLNNIVPHKNLTCLVAKASADESMLWHRRLGKQHKASCKTKLVNFVSKPLHTLHMDLFGPTSISSLNHKWYCLVVTDDFSRCDNGGEFKNKEMNEFCTKKGIKIEFSNARTPQQNGVAERRNRTLIEVARTMLADVKLPVTFWVEAVNTTCYVQNRVLVNKSQNKTPYELFNSRTHAIGFLRPFGYHVMILNTLDHLEKFDAKGDEGYFVGYSMSSKAFRVFNKRTKKVEENLHVDFLKNKLIEKGADPNWLFDIDTLTNSMTYVPVWNLQSHCYFKNSPAKQMESLTVESEFPTVSSLVPTIFLDTSHETSSDSRLISKEVISQEETPSLDNALTLSKRFEDTIRVEADLSNMEHKSKEMEEHSFIATIHQKTTPDLLQFCLFSCFLSHKEPKKIVDALKDPSWVEAMQEELLQFKIQNEEVIDYEEVFALVARIEAIRLFLAYALFMGFTVYQMDVKSAFLYGTINEEVYVMQPLGFQDLEFPDRVYKVEKAMYELHQAPRSWYGTLSKYLLDNGFQRVLQKKDGIFLSQDKYVGDILKKFGYSDVRSANTPMDKENPWGKDGTGKDVELHLYRSIIGSLLYLTASRPDIMFAVCAYARHQTIVATSTIEAEYVAAAGGCG